MLCYFLLICFLFCGNAVFSQVQESEAETIARCLRDLRSNDLERRRAASLVIGKYDTAESRQAVLDCLRDEDKVIRQNALVSLIEEDRMINPEAGREIILLLRDPDVHIRRIASSQLGRAASRNVRISGANVIIRGNLVTAEQEAQDDQVKQIINEALLDEDASVRRNVLLAADYFPGLLNCVSLETFFEQDSLELLILALRAYKFCPGDNALKAILAEKLLQKNNDPQLRYEIVYLAANLGEEGEGLLQLLAKDPADAVRVAAIRILADNINEENFKLLKTAILDESIAADLRRQLISPLRKYEPQNIELFKELLKSKDATLRIAAFRMFLMRRDETLTKEEFLNLLQDNNSEMRQLCIIALRRKKDFFAAEEIFNLLKSPHQEVRSASFNFTANEEVLYKLAQMAIMDENAEVRRNALQVFAKQRKEGYIDILCAAIEDDSPQVRDLAATRLIPMLNRKNQQAIDAIKTYLETSQNHQIINRIKKLNPEL